SGRTSLSSSDVHHFSLRNAGADMVIRGLPSALALSSSKPISSPGDLTSQSGGTSKAVPHLGLTTTFQSATVGFSVSVVRGFSDAGAEGVVLCEALGDGLVLPPALSSLPSLPRTRNPVTPAATTTAVAAPIATYLVRFPPPPPLGGFGAP